MFKIRSNVNFSIKGVDSESLILMLDIEGVCASSGSACNSGILAPSHVITAIGIDDEMAISTVRFTLGEQNTFEDICVITDVLKKITEKLRKNDVKKDIKCNFEYKK